ncbi:MAG: hypothetical protein KDA42_17075, partial [Planctomycetales bacterium]|nr:hypothetical protein [Planctomycetales bacterium]
MYRWVICAIALVPAMALADEPNSQQTSDLAYVASSRLVTVYEVIRSPACYTPPSEALQITSWPSQGDTVITVRNGVPVFSASGTTDRIARGQALTVSETAGNLTKVRIDNGDRTYGAVRTRDLIPEVGRGMLHVRPGEHALLIDDRVLCRLNSGQYRLVEQPARIVVTELIDEWIKGRIFTATESFEGSLPSNAGLFVLRRSDDTNASLSDANAVKSVEWFSSAGFSPVVNDKGHANFLHLAPTLVISNRRNFPMDWDMAHLDGVPTLKILMVNSPLVTDAGLKHIASLTRLTSLDVDCTTVSDKGMGGIGSNRHLIHLSVRCPLVTDSGMVVLRNMQQLADIRLEGCDITGTCLANVSRPDLVQE